MATNNESPANEIICTCTGTTYKEVADLFAKGYDLDGIASKKGVLSGCGGCEWDVETFLTELEKLQKAT